MRLLLTLFTLPLLFGFNFSPMSQSIDMGNSRKGTQFLIENDGPGNIAVELSVKERKMDTNGVESLSDTTDITVFPPQLIVPPGEKRTIRVTYNGKDKFETEKNYRVIAEQLPLNVDEKAKSRGGISMLLKFVAALYASPPDAKADVEVVSVESKGEELTIVLKNKGDRHQIIANPVLRFSADGKKGEITSEHLAGLAGENVLAGHTRKFVLKKSKPIPKGAKVELKLHE